MSYKKTSAETGHSCATKSRGSSSPGLLALGLPPPEEMDRNNNMRNHCSQPAKQKESILPVIINLRSHSERSSSADTNTTYNSLQSYTARPCWLALKILRRTGCEESGQQYKVLPRLGKEKEPADLT